MKKATSIMHLLFAGTVFAAGYFVNNEIKYCHQYSSLSRSDPRIEKVLSLEKKIAGSLQSITKEDLFDIINGQSEHYRALIQQYQDIMSQEGVKETVNQLHQISSKKSRNEGYAAGFSLFAIIGFFFEFGHLSLKWDERKEMKQKNKTQT